MYTINSEFLLRVTEHKANYYYSMGEYIQPNAQLSPMCPAL